MKPFLKWAGGKRWFAHRLSNPLPLNFQRYVEPFLGSGAIYFQLLPNLAWLSDKNEELINAYCAIRDDWEALLELLKTHQNSHCKDYYYFVRGSSYNNSTEKAARFIYLNRTCFNGLYRENKHGKFNVPIGTKNSVVWPDDDFERISLQLRNATILYCDFEIIIDQTGEGDLIFVDPPYTVQHNNNGFVRYNEKIFCWNDQVRLSCALRRAADRGAKMVMTNAFHASVKSLYQDWCEVGGLERHSILSGSSKYRNCTQEALITFGIDSSLLLDDRRARRYKFDDDETVLCNNVASAA